MANTDVHREDTGKAIGDTLSDDKKEYLKDVLHMVVDMQRQKDGPNIACNDMLNKLERSGITTEKLCQEFFKNGVDPNEIEKNYNGNKKEFLVDWLFQKHGPSHQIYTHKGADYDYSRENDKDEWAAPQVQASWLVKRYVLVNCVKYLYSLSDNDAERVGVTFYSVHRLRDLETNGSEENTTPNKKSYLFNLPDDLENYTLPLIKDEKSRNRMQSQIDKLRKAIESFKQTNSWDEITKVSKALIGSYNDEKSKGYLNDVIPSFIKNREQEIQKVEKPSVKHSNFSEKPDTISTLHTAKNTPKSSGGASGGGLPIKPIIIIIVIIILLLLLLKQCGSKEPEVVVQPPPPVDDPIDFDETSEVLFIANSSELLPIAIQWLDEKAESIKQVIEKKPDALFQIIGYTAIVPGFPDPNVLSLERAQKITKELISRNIQENQLQAIGGGETDQWGNNFDEKTKSPNRRIVIKELKK